MDVTQMPVKESFTPPVRLRRPLSRDLIRCIFGVHVNGPKPFMNKRLPKKKLAVRRAGAPRPLRVERARPNRYHTFLKRLHAGGRSNMYGAIPYLMSAFGVDREAAFRIVCDWVDQQQSEAVAVSPAGAAAAG
jgi:hypothetical protein